MNKKASDGYWTYSESGNLEFRKVETDELLDEVPFAKARSLAAFMLWQIVESFGSEEDDDDDDD